LGAEIRRREPYATDFPDAVEIELARYPKVDQFKSELVAVGFVKLHEFEVEIAAELTGDDPTEPRIIQVNN